MYTYKLNIITEKTLLRALAKYAIRISLIAMNTVEVYMQQKLIDVALDDKAVDNSLKNNHTI